MTTPAIKPTALSEGTPIQYITQAFDPYGKMTISQIIRRHIVFRDGVAIDDGTPLPPEFIQAPQVNDAITATLTQALDAVAAGHILAVAEARAENETLTADYEAKLTAKAKDAEELKAVTDKAATDAAAELEALKAEHATALEAAQAETARLRIVVDSFATPVEPASDLIPAPLDAPVPDAPAVENVTVIDTPLTNSTLTAEELAAVPTFDVTSLGDLEPTPPKAVKAKATKTAPDAP